MWIRSQDKFQITNGQITYKVRGYNTTCWKIYLVNENNSNEEKTMKEVAKYSSREKALKVLDLLEKHINIGGRMFVTDQTKTDFGMSAVYERRLGVFQFPQEEEIE